MTESELIAIVTGEMNELAASLTAADYANAVYTARIETSFTLPNTDETQIYWLKERTKRHLIFMLATGAAKKFQVKQIKLSEKFRNLRSLYTDMDALWIAAKEDLGLGVVDSYLLFGTKIDAGFSYDPDTGQDTTYDADQLVIATPGDIE